MEEKIDISTQKTKLEWDNYINYLIEAIDESNFMKRAENKPMQTSRHDLEAHVSSRASHVRAAADIAKRIAERLGLNADFVYAGMLMHDAGHPPFAHDGEEIYMGIAEVYNVDYFHHNAKGVEVILDENIRERAINKIPNIKNRPELRKKLEQEFYYFLDIVISHDGEASPKLMTAKPREYSDIKTAVFDKLRRSNSTNDYKFIAQTAEGRIAKYADVIAYLSSDIQDRFRLGIQNNFDDDYKEFIGDILSEEYAETREEKIEIANNIIEEIKNNTVMQLLSDANETENKEIIEYSNKIVGKIHEVIDSEKIISIEEKEAKAEEIIDEYVEKYKESMNTDELSDEEKKFISSDVAKIREFTRNKLRMRTAVVETITSRIREVLINDLIKESKDRGELGFSDIMNKKFFKAKELNYRYVPDTRWDYQREILPLAVNKLVHMIALDLRKSGVIQNKFYDREIRKFIRNKETLKYLKTTVYVNDDQQIEFKKKTGIKNVNIRANKFTTEGGKRSKRSAKGELCNSAYHYVSDFGKLFARIYENTYFAVEDQILSKIRNTLGRLPQEEAKKRKTHIKFFDEKVKKQEEYFKRQLKEIYGEDLDSITEEQIMEFARPIIDLQRKKMEGKMAVQMAINYLSGMTDKAIITNAMEAGLLNEEDLSKSARGSNEDEKNEFKTRYDTNVDKKEPVDQNSLPGDHSDTDGVLR